MLGNKSKSCSGQSQIIGFAGGGADDVVQLVIDGDDMMTTGEYVLQKIGRNINNLAIRPHIFRGDAFTASLFACQSQRMIVPHDTDKGIVSGNPFQGVIVKIQHLLGIGQKLEAHLGK